MSKKSKKKASKKVSKRSSDGGSTGVLEAEPPGAPESLPDALADGIPQDLELDDSWEPIEDTIPIRSAYEDEDLIANENFRRVWDLIGGLPEDMLKGTTIHVHRLEPEEFRGIPVGGVLGQLTFPYTTRHIVNKFGGGLLQLTLDVRVKTGDGIRRKRESATMNFPGLPKAPGVDIHELFSGGGGESAAIKLLSEQLNVLQQSIINKAPSVLERVLQEPALGVAYLQIAKAAKELLMPSPVQVGTGPTSNASTLEKPKNLIDMLSEKAEEMEKLGKLGKQVAKLAGLKVGSASSKTDGDEDDEPEEKSMIAQLRANMGDVKEIFADLQEMMPEAQETDEGEAPVQEDVEVSRMKISKVLADVFTLIWEHADEQRQIHTSVNAINAILERDVPVYKDWVIDTLDFPTAWDHFKKFAVTERQQAYLKSPRAKKRIGDIIKGLKG